MVANLAKLPPHVIIVMFQIEFDTQEIEGALPDYRYISRLGSGAFATVHLVADRSTDEQLALKKICCFGLGDYEKSGAVNEVRILSSLDHNNIIKINEEIIYMFMEYASEGDLTTLIQHAQSRKNKRIPEPTIWKAISDISDGLQYLHRNSIIHRDIKPANIFRTNSNFKIGDMNVSKVLKDHSFATTKTGAPLYTAPEIWQSEHYDEKCDIWSLGVLIYEMCALEVPFDASSIEELRQVIRNKKLKSIPSIYSRDLESTLRRMLEKSPAKRISAREVFEIAHAKLNAEFEDPTEQPVPNLMETILFPENSQRWVNLIPLPPRAVRKESQGPPSVNGSRRKSKCNEQSRERSQQKLQSRSRKQSWDQPREQSWEQQKQNTRRTNIFAPHEKKVEGLPKSRSKTKQQIPSQNDMCPVKLPSIHKRQSSQEVHQASNQQTSRNKSKSSSSRINRKILERHLQSAKKLVNIGNTP